MQPKVLNLVYSINYELTLPTLAEFTQVVLTSKQDTAGSMVWH